jgi:pyruvate,orthophosphate dikinase
MILSETVEERRVHLDKLFEFQHADMYQLFEVMDGLPVTIRLLDPPLHEFLPHDAAGIKQLADSTGKSEAEIETLSRSLMEVNPMLGFRGCRLSVVYPEITEMQVKAIISAAADAIENGIDARPEIMIPLVINVREVRLVSDIIEQAITDIMSQRTVSVPYKVGTMMETPRACLGADRLAPAVEFMSFGTNDLTQMTYGFSRDDAGRFIPEYLEKSLINSDPFVALDQRGVGDLMKIALERSRKVKPGIKYGICGEHGGDPESVLFCHNIGLDYVSCSPFRLPVARISAAQAAVKDKLR